MSEWAKTTLGDVLTLQRGFDLPKKSRKPGPYPVVSSSGFTGHHDEFKVNPPGVVIGRYGSLGSVHWVEKPFWPHNTSLWVKDFKGNDERFVYYLMQTIGSDGSSASAVPGVNRNHLHRLHVLLPDIETQTRIASTLRAFDELIEINERRIELLEDLARSLYREWFVHFRFPGHENEEMTGSGPGRKPQSWKNAKLGDVAVINGAKFRPSEIPDPFVYMDISTVGVGRVEQGQVMDADDAPGRARRKVRDGDTVWATVRPNRRAHALIHEPPVNLVASTGLAVLTPSRVPSTFLFEFASEPSFGEYLVSQATGSAYPAVRPTDFEKAPVPLPPSQVLQEFDLVAEPVLRLSSSLRVENSQLSEARDLLLPQLVTGKLDISNIDLGMLTPAEAA